MRFACGLVFAVEILDCGAERDAALVEEFDILGEKNYAGKIKAVIVKIFFKCLFAEPVEKEIFVKIDALASKDDFHIFIIDLLGIVFVKPGDKSFGNFLRFLSSGFQKVRFEVVYLDCVLIVRTVVVVPHVEIEVGDLFPCMGGYGADL